MNIGRWTLTRAPLAECHCCGADIRHHKDLRPMVSMLGQARTVCPRCEDGCGLFMPRRQWRGVVSG